MIINIYLSIILNVNGLNISIKRHRVAEWINPPPNKTHIYAIYERLPSDLNTQTESEGMEKDIPCKWKRKDSWASNT